MKKNLLHFMPSVAILFFSYIATAQNELAADQNPNYAVSRTKYMQIADSINKWHSTTQQEIYKAVDWLADRNEARADRREFRRQLRMERSRWDHNYYSTGYYPVYYRNYNNRYRYNNYRRHRSFGIYPSVGLNFWWR